MRKVVLLYTAMTPSVRLCGYEQFSFLAQQGLLSFSAISLYKATCAELKTADAVVFVRGDSYYEYRLAALLKTAGKYLIYVMDDDLLDVPSYISSAEHYRQEETAFHISSLMQLCDCFMTPSARLLQKYGDRFEKSLLIEEPALDCMEHAERSSTVKIGFAGSIDRTTDVEQLLEKPLRNLVNKMGDLVSVEFFGAKPKIAEELNCRWIPYADSYEKYQKTMQELNWDIGLAPMPDTEFHACKHYNKFIEYGNYGIISVCSDRLPYTRIIRNWDNGVLCPDDADAWELALMRLVQDTKLRKEMRNRLQEQIRSEFSVSHVSAKLWKQLDGNIPALKEYRLEAAHFFCLRISAFGKKLCKYGWKIFPAAWRKLKKSSIVRGIEK